VFLLNNPKLTLFGKKKKKLKKRKLKNGKNEKKK